MVATGGQENPAIVPGAKLAFLMGIPAVGLHQGQRPNTPHQKAGHMTAVNRLVRSKKVLAIRGRPHRYDWGQEPYNAEDCAPLQSRKIDRFFWYD